MWRVECPGECVLTMRVKEYWRGRLLKRGVCGKTEKNNRFLAHCNHVTGYFWAGFISAGARCQSDKLFVGIINACETFIYDCRTSYSFQ